MESVKEMKIIFLGTPDFAVATLKELSDKHFNVVAVVTAPDKPGGRGMKLQQSAVKKFALEKNITILQPEKLKDPAFLEQLKSYDADIQVVVAFRMLPEVVWNMPKFGTINLHASLLPQYRGAAPINWAIINGEKATGVTTFKLQQQIDTGNILLQKEVAIVDNESAGVLHDKLMTTGAELMIETLEGIQKNSLTEKPQVYSPDLKTAPKIFPETCRINWEKDPESIYDLIRGLSPYPGAYTFLNGKKLKIFEAEKSSDGLNLTPGQYKTDNKTFLNFACKGGSISVKFLQLEGKNKMKVKDFLRGHRIDPHTL